MGCWPAASVGGRGRAVGREMALCGVQLSQEGSPTTGPSRRSPNNVRALVFASCQVCYFSVPITRFFFMTNTDNSLQFLCGILLTKDGRKWSVDCVFATLYCQGLSLWVPWNVSLWTDTIGRVIPSPLTQIKKVLWRVPKDRHFMTSQQIIPSCKELLKYSWHTILCHFRCTV